MKAYLELDEVNLMEDKTSNVRDRLLIRFLFRLGCRVSEALALKVEDVDFAQGTVSIQHLKSRFRMSCTKCGVRLSRSHTFCPECGAKVEKALVQEREHRRLRTLPIDEDTLQRLGEYIRRGGPVCQKGKMLIFGINRHRAWQ